MTITNTKPKEWEEITLGEVADVNEQSIDNQYPYREIEYIDVSSVKEGRVLRIKKISLDEAPSRAKRIVRDNDILISTVRPNLKHFCFIRKAKPNLIASTGFAVISAKKSNPRFLYYLLADNKYTDYLVKIADTQTSTYPAFNPEIITNSSFNFPHISEQKEIASVLSSLDDKIELLREQNKTLEQIAQTIFHEWFIEFNFPNEEGKPYKLSGGKMMNSELGEIPERWGIKAALEIANISIGRTPPRKEKEWFSLSNKDNKWMSIKDLGKSGVFINTTEEHLTDEAIQRFRVPLIKENTAVVSFKLTVGRVSITMCDMFSNEAIAQFKPINKIPVEFIYLWLKNFNFEGLGSTSSIATATNSKTIKNMPFLVIDDKTMKYFTTTISPIFNKIRSNTKRIFQLSHIRDALLPKLISGELRVK